MSLLIKRISRLSKQWVLVALVIGLCFRSHRLFGEDRKKTQKRIDPAGISGALVICGGGSMPASVYERFRELAGGDAARLVIVPTASRNVDEADNKALVDRWRKRGASSVKILHTRDRDEANDPDFLTPLKQATGVWFGGGQQSRLAAAYQGTKFETELKKLLKRGRVVGGTSAGAAIQSCVMIASGNPKPTIKMGLDLLPDGIIDQHFTERNRLPRLRSAVKQHPECVGFGIDEGTALIVGTESARTSSADRGRTMRIIGQGNVTVVLAASQTKPMKEIRLGEGDVLDLTQLRRAARERMRNFPPKSSADPSVPRGALVIIGGGPMPRDIVKKIIELAGGPQAKIVALPTAYDPESERREQKPSYFVRAGAENITILPEGGPESFSSPETVAALKNADCLWFDGGRQWRYVDAYDGTPAIPLFHEVLKRGGVICGSSAGASIQGEYLARADALTNGRILAEGYQRGFNFLPGTAIDQHFGQRDRFGDLRHLVETYPQFLGIGIDEATAIVVRGEIAQVMGRHEVHFFAAENRTANGKIRYESVPAGWGYHLGERKVLGAAVAEKTGDHGEDAEPAGQTACD